MLNITDLKQDYTQHFQNDDAGGFYQNFLKWPEGNGIVIVRLLPPAKKGMFGREKNPFYTSTRVHKINGRSYHCPKEFSEGRWRGKCPICDVYNNYWQKSKTMNPDEAKRLQAIARSIKPIERYYYNILVRQQLNSQTGEVEKNVGPKIMSVGKTLHGMILRAILGSEELQEAPLGDVTDLKTGRDFKIVKAMRQSGEENFPNYSDSKFNNPSVLGEPEQVEAWLAGLHDLSGLREIESYQALHKQCRIHLGFDKDDAVGFNPDEFADDDTPVATQSKVDAPVVSTVSNHATTTHEEIVVGGGDESIADEDFLNELRNVGKK